MKKILFFLSFFYASHAQMVLPFFDDFSDAVLPNANPKYWKTRSVYVNNSLVDNAPSLNVATFDGVANNGFPYNYDNKFAYGKNDTLASQAIDLSKVSPTQRNKTILSFEVLAKGLGERPDPEDSLSVEFLDAALNWKQVKVKYINNAQIAVSKTSIQNILDSSKKTDVHYFFERSFKTVFFEILNIGKDSLAYFHPNFQFRIIGHGRQSGAFDMWHIDYVFLNIDRSISGTNEINDFSVSGSTGSILKNYSAMPMSQFLVNPAKELKDSLKNGVVNHSSSIRGLSGEVNFEIIDAGSSELLWKKGYVPNKLYLPSEAKYESIKIEPFAINSKNSEVIARFSLNSADDTLAILKRNNSVESRTFLGDYFAYDDGTAEYAAEVEKKLSKVAVLFELRKEEVLGSININFMPFLKNQEGAEFILQVFDAKLDTKNSAYIPGQVLVQQLEKLVYPSKINGFVNYKLKNPIQLKDRFFVAITKIGDENLPIGIDKNTPNFYDKIFYNNGAEWIKNDEIKAALMLRPVLSYEPLGPPQILAINAENNKPLLFPNPSKGLVNINRVYSKIEVFSSTGRKVFVSDTFTPQIDLSGLINGVYSIILDNSVQSKILISK